MKSFVLAALLAGSSLSVLLPVLQPQTAIAKPAPAFKNQAELETKYKQIKVGWTKQAVKDLLGQPQWAMPNIWNYYVSPQQFIKAIEFKGDRVSKLGDMAG